MNPHWRIRYRRIPPLLADVAECDGILRLATRRVEVVGAELEDDTKYLARQSVYRSQTIVETMKIEQHVFDHVFQDDDLHPGSTERHMMTKY